MGPGGVLLAVLCVTLCPAWRGPCSVEAQGSGGPGRGRCRLRAAWEQPGWAGEQAPGLATLRPPVCTEGCVGIWGVPTLQSGLRTSPDSVLPLRSLFLLWGMDPRAGTS